MHRSHQQKPRYWIVRIFVVVYKTFSMFLNNNQKYQIKSNLTKILTIDSYISQISLSQFSYFYLYHGGSSYPCGL